ncbi:alpha-hydroxy acid oxidase [Castellaniella caeni]|uniref:alpha-hydroxy acid oxidase n=1 Tax=Castellaniella caeni TaxID=266123 RepID=UPI000833B12A|nr:alpha-hydroxy acid oxidase [Castellaniella caeni]
MNSPPPVPLCAQDYADLARARLDPAIWAWLESGSADQLTAQDNQQAYARLKLRSRVLRPLQGAHTRLTLAGQALRHPILIAPSAWHGLVHPEAEQATALAAAATGTLLVLSAQSGTPIETLAALPAPPTIWFQLYAQARPEDTLALAERAIRAGAQALVLTVDAPVNGIRNAEQRSGFRCPPHIRSVHLDGLSPAQARPTPPGGSPLFDSGLLDVAPTWDTVTWLRQQFPQVPLWLKGILDPEDARLAMQHGASGLIVSNHGGRCLDTLPATIEALPAIARAVDGALPILLDGGIRRGSDILKALALGAQAVLIGRPALHALAVGGASGLAHLIQLLRGELEVAMALTGCRTLDEIGPHVLWDKPGHGSAAAD